MIHVSFIKVKKLEGTANCLLYRHSVRAGHIIFFDQLKKTLQSVPLTHKYTRISSLFFLGGKVVNNMWLGPWAQPQMGCHLISTSANTPMNHKHTWQTLN